MCDSTVLILLERIGRLDLLEGAFEQVVVPEEVRHEFGPLPGFVRIGISTAEFVQRTTLTSMQASALGGHQARALVPPHRHVYLLDGRVVSVPESLGVGEVGAVQLAVRTSGSVLLSDDKAARRFAAAPPLSLAVSGTLGVLRISKASGRLPMIGPVLRLLLSEGFHISPTLSKIVLEDAGEPPESIDLP